MIKLVSIISQIQILTGYYLRIRQAGPSRSVVFIASVASPEVNVARGCLTFSYRQSSVGAFARLRVKTLERYGSQEESRTKRHLTATQTWKEEKIDFQTSRPYKVNETKLLMLPSCWPKDENF
jgi:hypothetical protein